MRFGSLTSGHERGTIRFVSSRGLQGLLRRLYGTLRFGRRYKTIRFARRYDRGKSFEDHENRLVGELTRIAALDGAEVADIGAGTGQIAKRIGQRTKRYYGFDPSVSMIQVANEWRAEYPAADRVTFEVATAVAIPLPGDAVDITVYPWSMNSILGAEWAGDWRGCLRVVLREAGRITRPGGTIVVIETASLMGELPWGQVWHPTRRAFLSELEAIHGFTSSFYSNDWNFCSRRNLRRYGELWFKRETLSSVLRSGSTVLKECVGMWWRREPLDTNQTAADSVGST